jgi:hypothetical protein
MTPNDALLLLLADLRSQVAQLEAENARLIAIVRDVAPSRLAPEQGNAPTVTEGHQSKRATRSHAPQGEQVDQPPRP